MHHRVAALVVVFILLCSGFTLPDQAMAAATQTIEPAVEWTLGGASHHGLRGSVDDCLADLPAPVQAESAEEPLLVEAASVPDRPALTSALPDGLGLAALEPLILEGPLRPPCSIGFFA